MTDGEVVEDHVEVPAEPSEADRADEILEGLAHDSVNDRDGADGKPGSRVFGTRSSSGVDTEGDASPTPAIDPDELSDEERDEIVRLFPEVVAERDDYLDTARRVQAEFENFRRRVESQRADQVARAAERLVVEVLPVLDACEAAIGHGADDVEPIYSALVATLTKQGLALVADVEVEFDPNVHEAVMSEPGDGTEDGHVVAEIMRTGYLWNGNVVRPAMVKVRG